MHVLQAKFIYSFHLINKLNSRTGSGIQTPTSSAQLAQVNIYKAYKDNRTRAIFNIEKICRKQRNSSS
jgi:hypothetical protein